MDGADDNFPVEEEKHTSNQTSPTNGAGEETAPQIPSMSEPLSDINEHPREDMEQETEPLIAPTVPSTVHNTVQPPLLSQSQEGEAHPVYSHTSASQGGTPSHTRTPFSQQSSYTTQQQNNQNRSQLHASQRSTPHSQRGGGGIYSAGDMSMGTPAGGAMSVGGSGSAGPGAQGIVSSVGTLPRGDMGRGSSVVPVAASAANYHTQQRLLHSGGGSSSQPYSQPSSSSSSSSSQQQRRLQPAGAGLQQHMYGLPPTPGTPMSQMDVVSPGSRHLRMLLSGNSSSSSAYNAGSTYGRQTGTGVTAGAGGAGGGGGGDGDDDDDDNHDDNDNNRDDPAGNRGNYGGFGAGGGGGGRGGGGDGENGHEHFVLDEMVDDDLPDQQLQQHLAETRIWGTDVNVQSCMNIFRNFLQFFRLSNATTAAASSSSYYQQQLLYMHHTGDMLLNLNCAHLKAFPPTRNFYAQLCAYPQELIPIMDRVVHEEFARLYGETDGLRRIQVRTFGIEEQSRMRSLDPKDIDRLLSIKGMVTRCSSIIPDLKQAYFRCFVCSHGLDVLIDRGRIEEPRSCPECQTLASMELIHNRCLFTDKQLIRLQETPDEVPAGETPHNVTLFAFDDLVDTVRPGDRIEVTGIFRAVANRTNPRLRTLRSIYKTYLDAIHFRRAEEQQDTAADTTSGVDRTVSRTTRPSSSSSSTSMSATAERVGSATGGGGSGGGSAGIGGGSGVGAAQFSAARVADFEQFAAQGHCYERLLKSFAPSIWEMDDVKRGMLCLLFGGTIRKGGSRKTNRRRRRRGQLMDGDNYGETDMTEPQDDDDYHLGGREEKSGRMEEDEEEEEEDEAEDGDNVREDAKGGVHQRGDINILLCGDPGTSKSQLLSYVHKLTARGIYTSGKGSSAVGLTASVVRDPETRDMVLESGALVLSDNGICCIDEFDKMTDQTRAILHEAMEQQTVSITKAGIIATLNARTSILASANPVQSRYNPKLSVVENIKLPPTLLSRFDLIYLILDKPNADNDRKLAKHLVSLYYEDEEEDEAEGAGGGGGGGGGGADASGRRGLAGAALTADTLGNNNNNNIQPVDQQFLREYIMYARENIMPEISTEAEELLVRNYVEMRSLGSRSQKTITATPRQLESLIRLAQALAKMRLSDEVTAADVLEATRLMKVATQTAATDPRTGTIDMDLISTGKTALDRDLVLKLADELRRYLSAPNMRGQRMTVGQIRQNLLRTAGGEGEGAGLDGSKSTSAAAGGLGMMASVSMAEVEDAVRELEMEGMVQLIDRTQTVIVRGGGGGGANYQ